MDGGNYVPNNPQFGLQLECNWTPSIATAPVQQTANGCAVQVSSNCSSAAGGAGVADGAASVPGDDLSPWPEDMGSFTLPLDLDPLPTLFPFSPCATTNNNNYKIDNSFHSPPSMTFRESKPSSGDVADVLLSLKHAVVHPEQEQQQQQQQQIYHPQVLLSPNSCPGTFCDQPFTQQPSAPVFPSMSVNVSMNMTMHGYHPAAAAYPTTTEITYPQVQWNSGPQFSPSTQGLLSPGYGSATYSFTADFRPPQHQEPPSAVFSAAYKPVMSLSSPRRKHHHSLPVHFEEENQKPNVCRICGKSYARPSTLKTHLRTHSGEKPYRCIDCNKSFSQAANLTAHVRTHSGEKPFRCPVCDRRFSQSSSVTTHMRTHSGERPYRCRLCKKAFSDSSTLTKHLRIHSGEKPYECKLCLLRFSQSGNLNRHMRVHGNNGTMVIT